MNDYYPPGTPSDFLKEDEPEMIDDFKQRKIDARELHWETDSGAIPVDSLDEFVNYLIEEEFEILKDIVHRQLDDEWPKKGGD